MVFSFMNQIICSGGLFLSAKTKRFLFLLRNHGKTAGTWGFVGGRKEPRDLTPVEALKRETEEEVGKIGQIKKIVPLELFISEDQKFQYNTYVVIVENEFIPTLNDEHCGYCWTEFKHYPKPLHPGLFNTINFDVVLEKIERLIKQD